MCESGVCLSGIQGIPAIFFIVETKSQRKVASENKEGLIWARGLKAHGLKAHGLKAHSLKVQSAIEKAQEQKRQAVAHLHTYILSQNGERQMLVSGPSPFLFSVRP